MSSLEQEKQGFTAHPLGAPEEQSNPRDGDSKFANARSNRYVAANASPFSFDSYHEPISVKSLTVAVISPNEDRRSAAVKALAGCTGSEAVEFSSYPPGIDDVPRLLEEKYDVVIIELDSDPEYALELVESIDANGPSTVMVLSDNSDPELLVRSMRAGAREFLTLPLTPEVMAEALVRAAARRPVAQNVKKTTGKLLAFMGAKGGAGTTMVACNFAVAMAKDSGQSTLLIDLDLPLGDSALNLGIAPEFSAIDALAADERLDGNFLRQLLVKHNSGLFVLAAPGKFVQYQASLEAINRLLFVARQEFEYVVVDLGSRLDLMESAAYKEATTVYLVTQASIPELRNSHRVISQFFTGTVPKLEIVVNRFESRVLGVSEEHIAKALTRPPQWKIPNDFQSVRKMQIDATPLVLSDSPITRQIRQMVKAVMGKTEVAANNKKKKAFSLSIFG